MDRIKAELKKIVWEYADKDMLAIKELEYRISEKGKTFGLISYSDLVRRINFHYPNIKNGAPYQIMTHDWSGLDRRIIGDCLGFISTRSYLSHGFMVSALVVARLESKPSDIFFERMNSLDLIPDLSEDSILVFWAHEVKKAHHWYKYEKKI